MTENRVIVLVGPTAVGKTGVAMELALALDTEIVSADSMQIYRFMDIGTEKPSPADRARVPHHMIDIVPPTEDYSVGRYVSAVRPILDSLHGRGKIPIVTGGTGLYIKAMTRGLFPGPPADRGLREALGAEGPERLYARLLALDPEAAAGIMPSDVRRIVRALEVCMGSGRRISALRAALTEPLPYEFIKVALGRDRAELYPMIEGRAERMIERGLIEEVRALLEMGPARTPMQAIGYKEVAACLRGDYPIEEAVRLIKRNTKRYAKRQFTWFKKEEGLAWVDLTGVRDPRAALGPVLAAIKERGLTLPHAP